MEEHEYNVTYGLIKTVLIFAGGILLIAGNFLYIIRIVEGDISSFTTAGKNLYFLTPFVDILLVVLFIMKKIKRNHDTKKLLASVGMDHATIQAIRKLERSAQENILKQFEPLKLKMDDLIDTQSTAGVCAYKYDSLFLNIKITVKEEKIPEKDPISHLLWLQYNPDYYANEMEKVCGMETSKPSKMDEFLVHLQRMYQWANSPAKLSGCTMIRKRDVEYYKLEGTEQYVSKVTGGGVNLEGAFIGGVLAGDAGVVVGSRAGQEIKTEVEKKDNRKIRLYYRENNRVTATEIYAVNIDLMYHLMQQWMPDKEYEFVARQQKHTEDCRTQAETNQYAELKSLKELLDMGILTQEEFNTQKNKILNG